MVNDDLSMVMRSMRCVRLITKNDHITLQLVYTGIFIFILDQARLERAESNWN